MDKPISFNVKCSNEKHSIAAMLMSATDQNSTMHLIGLLPFTSYNCCVSAVYELYVADGVCRNITTPELFVTTLITKSSKSKASESVVGGILGSIVVILLILLIVALVHLMWQQKQKRSAKPSR